MKTTTLYIFVTILMANSLVFAKESGHDHEENNMNTVDGKHDIQKNEDEEGGESLNIPIDSMRQAGIVVRALKWKNLTHELSVSAEVKFNAYLSSKVTPQVTAKVVEHHAKLGDFVNKGQPLVTLSSVVMADAVSALLVTHQEWTRVQKLGKASVSSKRYNEVKIANTNALGKVIAYGMTRAQIKSVYDATLAQPLGTFQLLAPQSGVIINDDFIQGELISPGRILFNIINEDTLWAESQLSPKQAKTIRIGANARIRLSDNNWISGKVIQKRHTLNEKTRTIGIRMTFDNRKDLLHSGMYVDARIEQGQSQKYLAVPTQAVLRSADGDWVVFVEQSASGTFKPVEVEVLQIINNYTVIKGVEAGQRIVFQGAFFVQSELAKSGFSVHNH